MSDFLSQELVWDILSRLPSKSLIRFRSVCKEWYDLISSSQFVFDHLSSASTATTIVRFYSTLFRKEIYTLHCDNSTTRVGFPFHSTADFYTRIVGYCHGIFCLSDDLFGNRESITLWNTSINRAILVPTPRFTYSEYGPYMHALGFGFVPRTNDYKIVRLFYLLPEVGSYELPPRVELFSLASGEWTTLALDQMPVFITEKFWSQAIFQGFVHWNGYRKLTPEAGQLPYQNVILRFDLEEDVFEELGLPQALIRVPPMSILPRIVNGKFSVAHHDNQTGPNDCSIWVMEDYDDVTTWTHRYEIRLGVQLGTVLGMRRDGEIMVTEKSGELVSYDHVSGRVTRTGMSGSPYSFFMDDYVNSLVLFDRGNLVMGEVPENDSEDEDIAFDNEESRDRDEISAFITGMISQV